MAILEALACKAPVVITNACHFPEVAEAGAGEVVELNADAVAEGLRKILSDPGSKSRFGEAGRALVFNHYTWPKIAEKAIAAYQRK